MFSASNVMEMLSKRANEERVLDLRTPTTKLLWRAMVEMVPDRGSQVTAAELREFTNEQPHGDAAQSQAESFATTESHCGPPREVKKSLQVAASAGDSSADDEGFVDEDVSCPACPR